MREDAKKDMCLWMERLSEGNGQHELCLANIRKLIAKYNLSLAEFGISEKHVETLRLYGCYKWIEKMIATLRAGETNEEICWWLTYLIKEEMRVVNLSYADVDFDEVELDWFVKRFKYKHDAEIWIMRLILGSVDFDTCCYNIMMYLRQGQWSLSDVGVYHATLQDYYNEVGISSPGS
jgi:hypothetical protein